MTERERLPGAPGASYPRRAPCWLSAFALGLVILVGACQPAGPSPGRAARSGDDASRGRRARTASQEVRPERSSTGSASVDKVDVPAQVREKSSEGHARSTGDAARSGSDSDSARFPPVPRVGEDWARSLTNAALLATMPDAVTAVVVRRLEVLPLEPDDSLCGSAVGDATAGALHELLRSARPVAIAFGGATSAKVSDVAGGGGAAEDARCFAAWRIVVVTASLEALANPDLRPASAPRPRQGEGLTYYEFASGDDRWPTLYASLANDRALAIAPALRDLSEMVARLRRDDHELPERWSAAVAGLDGRPALLAAHATRGGGDRAAGFAESVGVACAADEAVVEAYGVSIDPEARLQRVLEVAQRAGPATPERERLRESSFMVRWRFADRSEQAAFVERVLPGLVGMAAR